MKKLLRSIPVLCILFSTTLFAGTSTVDLNISSGNVVGYGFRDIDGTAVTGSYTFSFDSGLYFNLWSSAEGIDQMHEVDYAIGYGFEPAKGWYVDVSANWWNFKPLGDGDGDLFAPIVYVEYAVSETVTLFGNAEYYFVKNDSGSNGLHAYIGVSKALRFGSVDVAISGQVGHDGTYGDHIPYATFGIQPSIALSNDLELRFLGFEAWLPKGEPTEHVITLVGVTYRF